MNTAIYGPGALRARQNRATAGRKIKRFRASSNIKRLSDTVRKHCRLRVLTQSKDRQNPRPLLGDRCRFDNLNENGIAEIKNLRDPVSKIKAEWDSQTQF